MELSGIGYITSRTIYELIDYKVIDNFLTGFEKTIHPYAKFFKGNIQNIFF